ncbi:AAA family ATPase, partial [Methylobacterium radiotolerans]
EINRSSAKTQSAMLEAMQEHQTTIGGEIHPLPSDITGNQIYDAATGSFRTVLGPVHANFVLLDEINRSSAKTQSAMLEAMQEHQTTIGGEIHPLP